MFQRLKKIVFYVCMIVILVIPVVHGQDTFETAVEIPVNQAIVWGLNNQNSVNWFKVILSADGSLNVDTYSDPPFERTVTTYVAKDIALSENQTERLAEGTYYIKVSLVSGGGNYTLNCLFVPTSYENDIEPNATADTADTLKVNIPDYGHIGYYSVNYHDAGHIDRTDWWMTTLSSDGVVVLTLAPDETLNAGFELYDQDKNTVLGSSKEDGDTQSLKHQYLTPGTYFIKVTLDDENGGFGSYSLENSSTSPWNENDFVPNDTADMARELELDSIKTGHLGFYGGGYTDTDDWWKVSASSDGSLVISTSSDSTLIINLMLYDQDKSGLLASQTGTGDFSVRRNDLLPGTYYINLRRWGDNGGGSYTITGSLTSPALDNDPESNNTATEASQLDIDGSDTGHLGFYGNATRDQYDWWKITTTLDGSLLISASADSTLGITLFLFDQNTTAHLGNNYGKDLVTVQRDDLSPGTYYIRLEPDSAESYGSYTLSSVFTPVSFVNDPEPNDSAEQASNLNPEGSDTAHLGYYSNQNRDTSDWWKVTTTEDGSLSITTDSDPILKLFLYFYDQDKTSLLAQSTTEGSNQTVQYDKLAEGSYYIEARRNDKQGYYIISSDFSRSSLNNDNEPNDTLEYAADVATDKTYPGHLGYINNGTSDNDDYFSFTLLTAWDNLYIVAESDSTLEINMNLHDINGSQIITTGTAGSLGQLHYSNASAGSYYVNISAASGYGSYAFIISQSSDTRPIFKNYPPEIITQSLRDALVGMYYEVKIEAIDPDEGDILTFELLYGPNWLDLDSNGILKGTPGENDRGTDIPVLLRVTDLGGYTDYLSRTLTVKEFKVLPPTGVTATDVPDDHGNRIQLSWTLSPDDDIVTNYNIYRSRSSELTEPIPLDSLESIEELISQEENNTIFIGSVPGGENSYIDRFIPTNGVSYYYWLQAEASSGTSEKVSAHTTIIITHVESAPSAFKIHPPCPNPFNPSTAIRYEVPFECHVRLVVYDILGREIVVLRNGIVSAGIHNIVWNGTGKNGMNVSSGVYLYRFEAGHEVAGQGKLMFLR